MRPFRSVFILAFFLATTQITFSQDPKSRTKGWDSKILGKWTADVEATQKLWNKTWLRDHDPRYMFSFGLTPFAIRFSENGELKLGEQAGKTKFKLDSFDTSNKILTVQLTSDFGISHLKIEINNDNTFTLRSDLSTVGPVKVVYSRAPDPNREPFRDSMKKLGGLWKLDREMTKAWYSNSIQKKYQDHFLKHAERRFADLDQLTIENGILSISDLSSERLELNQDSSIDLNKYSFTDSLLSSCQVQIDFLADGLIRYVDERRQFIGIYRKPDSKRVDGKEVIAKLKQSELEKSVLESRIPFTSPNDHPSRFLKIDGQVKLAKMEIQRCLEKSPYSDDDNQNHTEIKLTVSSDENFRRNGFFFKLNSLEKVLDDQGRVLDTSFHRKWIHALKYPIESHETGSSSAGFSFQLHVPAIGATQIKSLAGELAFSPYTETYLRIENLRARQSKLIKHPLLEGLKITPKVYEESNRIELIKEGDRHLLLDFVITGEKNRLWENSSSDGWDRFSKTYSDLPKNITLWLVIAKIESTKKHKFKFDNIKIPD